MTFPTLHFNKSVFILGAVLILGLLLGFFLGTFWANYRFQSVFGDVFFNQSKALSAFPDSYACSLLSGLGNEFRTLMGCGDGGSSGGVVDVDTGGGAGSASKPSIPVPQNTCGALFDSYEFWVKVYSGDTKTIGLFSNATINDQNLFFNAFCNTYALTPQLGKPQFCITEPPGSLIDSQQIDLADMNLTLKKFAAIVFSQLNAAMISKKCTEKSSIVPVPIPIWKNLPKLIRNPLP